MKTNIFSKKDLSSFCLYIDFVIVSYKASFRTLLKAVPEIIVNNCIKVEHENFIIEMENHMTGTQE